MITAFETLTYLEEKRQQQPYNNNNNNDPGYPLSLSNISASAGINSSSQPIPISSSAYSAVSLDSIGAGSLRVISSSTVRDSISINNLFGNSNSNSNNSSAITSSSSSSLSQSNLQQIPQPQQFEDPFDILFLDKLKQGAIGGKDEEEKLYTMKSFIKSASRATYT